MTTSMEPAIGWWSARQHEYSDWSKRDLTGKRYVYLWADGIYFGCRLTDDRPCVLVLMGVLDKLPKKEQPAAKSMLHRVLLRVILVPVDRMPIHVQRPRHALTLDSPPEDVERRRSTSEVHPSARLTKTRG